MLCMVGPHPLVHVSEDPWLWLGAANTVPLKSGTVKVPAETVINIWPKLFFFKMCQPTKNSVFTISSLMPFYHVSAMCRSYLLASAHFPPLSHLQGGWHLLLFFTGSQLQNQAWLSAPCPGGYFSEHAQGYRCLLLCKCQVVSGGCSGSEIASSKRKSASFLLFYSKRKIHISLHSL